MTIRQKKIIREQQQANERMLENIKNGKAGGLFRGQAPPNERLKQLKPEVASVLSPAQAGEPDPVKQ